MEHNGPRDSQMHVTRLPERDSETSDFEIVIGIVAPIGTDLESLFFHLQRELSPYQYRSHMIRLSRLLDEGVPTDPNTEANKCIAERLMDRGDDLRQGFKHGGALAALAIAKIWSIRKKDQIPIDQSSRVAWILRTLKHEGEVELLRHAYGSRFVLVGAQQNESFRQAKLLADLRDELPGQRDLESLAAHLISRDQMDTDNQYGQQVRDTYSLSDYFINLDANVEREVERFVGLLFGKPFLTPTRDEQAMFHAYASAFRSADPGRQVGAIVTTPAGELLVTGTNEVPRAGGGSYWEDDEDDKRDFQLGYNFNKRMNHRAMKEFIGYLADNELLNKELMALPLAQQYEKISSADRSGLKRLRLTSLIEFGRVSHAEMSAITQAARTSLSIDGGTIYSTTYPCHMCMRLIIASGIRRVVYIDPYPKSLAEEMYFDSLNKPGGITVSSFWGASWTIFTRVFQRINREEFLEGSYVADKSRMRLADHDPLAGAVDREVIIHSAISSRLDTK